MFNKPWLNAVSASGYIAVLVWIMMNIERVSKQHQNQYFLPVIFISIFTLSAAVMGGLFLLRPILMYLEGKKKPAVQFFFQTVGYFAGITVVLLVCLLLGIIPRN